MTNSLLLFLTQFIAFSTLACAQTFDGTLTVQVLNGWGFNVNSKEIDLSSRSISSIPDNTFQTFVNTERLFLGSNKLTKLTTMTFNGLNNLQVLDLAGNKIDTVPAILENCKY